MARIELLIRYTRDLPMTLRINASPGDAGNAEVSLFAPRRLDAHDPERPKIIVEVADTGFRSMWDRIFLIHTAAKLRRKGLSRMDAKRGAKEVVARIRSVAALRPFSA